MSGEAYVSYELRAGSQGEPSTPVVYQTQDHASGGQLQLDRIPPPPTLCLSKELECPVFVKAHRTGG